MPTVALKVNKLVQFLEKIVQESRYCQKWMIFEEDRIILKKTIYFGKKTFFFLKNENILEKNENILKNNQNI